jgi:hypothetical protein
VPLSEPAPWGDRAAHRTPLETSAALVATLTVTVVAIGVFFAERPAAEIDSGFAAGFVWLFSALFLVRVLGQIVVRLRSPSWLPPTEEWNLTPYRLLLPAQAAILALMLWIGIDLSVGLGPWGHPHPTFGRFVIGFAVVYATAMVIRYVIRMARHPEARWFGGAIPIVFHWVLAAYLLVVGGFHASY